MRCAIAVLVLSAAFVAARDNGAAKTPPMGWLSWERFRCNTDCTNNPETCISENLYMDMADRMAADGWLDVGYEYVNVDDCAVNKERVDGKQVADPTRFPHGFTALGNYVHSKGLKFGMYSDSGTETCGGYPGIFGNEKLDIGTFASWGIDSFKLDGCYWQENRTDYPAYYGMISDLLVETGRTILFSCSYPAYLQGNTFINYTYAAQICNGWRLYDDIQDSWSSVESIIDFWGDHQEELAPASMPGAQNDPDQVIIGDTALSTPAMARTQMGIWSIISAPLLMSNDLRNITAWQKEIMQNTEVIAVNQDPLVQQGSRVKLSVGEAWFKHMQGGDIAVGLRNTATSNATIVAPLHLVDIPSGKATARDLWAHANLGTVSEAITATVEPLGTAMFRLTPQ